MSIAESAQGTLGRKLGPLPVYGWAAIGVGTLVVVKLLRGGSGGSSPTVTVPDAFAGDDTSGGGSGAGTTLPTTPTPVGSGSPATAPAHYKVQLVGRTDIFSLLGKLISHGESGTYTATKRRVAGEDYYQFKRAGKWVLVSTKAKTIKVTQL